MAKELINKLKSKFKMNQKEKDIDTNAKNETVDENQTVEEQDNLDENEDSISRIEELEIQIKESKDKHLRLFAEFENFKKRNMRERIELMKTAAQDTMQTILPVLDDFDRAKKSAEDESSSEQLSEGVLMVYNKLYTVLANKGLTPMESTGKKFDPELHEAITEIPAATDDQKGMVIDTVETGYYLNDKIIRFAKVVVGK